MARRLPQAQWPPNWNALCVGEKRERARRDRIDLPRPSHPLSHLEDLPPAANWIFFSPFHFRALNRPSEGRASERARGLAGRVGVQARAVTSEEALPAIRLDGGGSGGTHVR